jgi:ERF superfamily
MPDTKTDIPQRPVAPGETGEGNGSGSSSGDAAGGAPAGVTTEAPAITVWPPHDPTPGSEPTIWSSHNVYQRIAWVITQLPAIPKDQEYDAGNTHYRYRGIEAIQRTAANLLAAAGVVYAPRARLIERDPDPPNTKPGWQDTHAEYEWIIHGTMGDQYLPAPVTLGIGRDNADKGANKGASQGLKYLLIALLQIADGKDDPDQHGDYGAQMTPEEAEAQAQREANPVIDRVTFDALVGRVKALPDDAKAQLIAAWTREDPDGQPYLPTVDGSPRIGSLRRNDLLAAEALILAAEKAAGAAPAQAGESVADRAARMARERTAAKPAEGQEAASDAAQEPEGDAGDDGTPETPAGPAAPIPEGTPVATLTGEPLPDLADMPAVELSGIVRATNERLGDPGFIQQVVEAVQHPYHHARVDAEIKGVPGQTVAEYEQIDHRRMRVALMRVLLELHRREAPTDG